MVSVYCGCNNIGCRGGGDKNIACGMFYKIHIRALIENVRTIDIKNTKYGMGLRSLCVFKIISFVHITYIKHKILS
jgi:hypothetical protein